MPFSRKAVLCRYCQRLYTRRRRKQIRENLANRADTFNRYCSTCGCRATEEGCCLASILLPAVPWRLWKTDQMEIGLTLLWSRTKVMTAEKMLLLTGGTESRLLSCGSKLWTADGALKSPFLYTHNAVGTLLFLTPRAANGEV